MRGVISLATALALPGRTDHGELVERDLMLFITFGVILVTLVGQGLSLAPLIRRLGVSVDDAEAREESRARRDAARAALLELSGLTAREPVAEAVIADLKLHYTQRIERLERQTVQTGQADSSDYSELRHRLLDVERGTVIDLRNRGVIGDDVLRRIQRELDLEQIRLEADLSEE